MLTVDNATRGVLKFATQMLNPMHDKLILARFRGHSQPGQLQDGNMDKRMMEHFQVPACLKTELFARGHSPSTRRSRMAGLDAAVSCGYSGRRFWMPLQDPSHVCGREPWHRHNGELQRSRPGEVVSDA